MSKQDEERRKKDLEFIDALERRNEILRKRSTIMPPLSKISHFSDNARSPRLSKPIPKKGKRQTVEEPVKVDKTAQEVIPRPNFSIEQVTGTQIIIHARELTEGIKEQIKKLLSRTKKSVAVDNQRVARRKALSYIIQRLRSNQRASVTFS